MNALERFNAWRDASKHLPYWLRTHENQDHYFMHLARMMGKNKPFTGVLSFQQIAVTIIDYFLWNMASHGYTLQKTKKTFKGLKYIDIRNTLLKSECEREAERMAFYSAVIKLEEKTD